jgi:hypothetical protein
MPTLLVNPKMDPALAARVHASVTGRRHRTGVVRSTARLVATVRFGVLLAIAGLVVAVLLQIRHDRTELADRRSTLLRAWNAQVSSFTPRDRSFLTNLQSLFARYSGTYPGDYVADELGTARGLAAALARPSVYVRGPIATLPTAEGLARAANDSGKDSLLVCLLAPPDSRSEKALLKTARMAMSGGPPVQALTPQVHRLLEAEVALPFVMPAWGERIRIAKDTHTLERLALALKEAPLTAAKRVLEAELVIAVFDEPSRSGAATELDGENTHYVRLAILELDSGRALLVMRRQVDPSWITPNRRSLYARELDGCKLALDVRDAVRSSPGAAASRPTSQDSR